jgi:serine/threonine-protein kinase
MTENPRVEQLVDEILDTERSPEEVCGSCPELLPEVRRRWQEMCGVKAELAALFPAPDAGADVGATPGLPANPSPPLIPGYEVEAVLGRGGMGVVYRARHLKLNRRVALKMLLAGDYAGPSERARFQREAEAVAGLRHANIVQVYDVGEQDGRPYFTMELVQGGSLAEKLAGEPQPARDGAALVVMLAQAMSAAHQGGIVHRDLKPANVLLTPPTDEGLPADGRPSWGTPKISDFGLARRLECGERLTQSGDLLGTPSYMAPEQARGRTQALGPPVDIYSLGAILYELLTGRPPFLGQTVAETVLQVISQDPVPPSRLNARLPRDLETICLKCLHKEPSRRYTSAAALAEDLRCFLHGEAIAARPEGRLERFARGVRRRPTLAVGLTTGVLLAIALVGGGLWLRGERAANDRANAEMQRLDQARRENEAALERLDLARRERQLAERLDAIHLNRAAAVNGRFDVRSIAQRADRDYEAAFREAGFGRVGDDPAAVAARIESSTIRDELVAALDDWAVSARRAGPASAMDGLGAMGVANVEDRRQRWLLDVLRRADPNPTAIRQRLRDPAVWYDHAALRELAETALADKLSAQLLVAVGERLMYAGADPVPFLQRVQREHPADFWANLALGAALVQKNPGESIRFIQAAMAIRPKTAIVHDYLGLALLGAGRPDDAIESFQQALLFDPEYVNTHNNLGYALRAKGRLDEAIAHFRHALRNDPMLPPAHCNLGSALIDLGRHDEALEHLREAIRLEPKLSQAHAAICAVLKARGGPQAVIAHYRQMLRTAPELAPAHAYLGSALAEVEQADEAIDHFRHALRIDPKLTVAHIQLGMALDSRGQYDEAADHYQQVVALEPRLHQAHAALGQTLLGLGRFREALDAARRGLDLLPPEHSDRAKGVQLLRRCENLLALEARLPAFLRGEDRLAGPADHLQFADVCRVKKRYADAARLFVKAFADKPQLGDEVPVARYQAARAAALAGCGQGEGGDKLSTEERAHWREQARVWLKADLTMLVGKLDTGTAADRARVRGRLTRWLVDPDLVGLREPSSLDGMTAEEREKCVAVWKEVNALLERARHIK